MDVDPLWNKGKEAQTKEAKAAKAKVKARPPGKDAEEEFEKLRKKRWKLLHPGLTHLVLVEDGSLAFSLREGLESTYEWMKNNRSNLRNI